MSEDLPVVDRASIKIGKLSATVMISSNNKPTSLTAFDSDFTESEYRRLVGLAMRGYDCCTFGCVPWGSRFVLWRHDLDCSLNRAVALARIEHEAGLVATYFINPRSEFYNPFEPSQARAVEEILSLGHHLGLHFDANFYKVHDEVDLARGVAVEAGWLCESFKVKLDAFTFHNPTPHHLSFEMDSYGGLVNGYSRRLKESVPYCSDSNGHWRFRRLRNVLEAAVDPCLQILTHPGWWQVNPMPPRNRMLRCAYGRAASAMREYDRVLRQGARQNLRGTSEAISFLEHIDPSEYEKIGTLWGLGYLEETLFALIILARRRVLSSGVPSGVAILERCEQVARQHSDMATSGARDLLERCCVQLCDFLRGSGSDSSGDAD